MPVHKIIRVKDYRKRFGRSKRYVCIGAVEPTKEKS